MIPNAPWTSPAFSNKYAVASEFLCFRQIYTYIKMFSWSFDFLYST